MNHQEPSTPADTSPASRPARGKAVIGSALALLALLGAGSFFLLRPATEAQATSPAQSAPPPMPVEVTEVVVAAADTEISAVGSLQSNESVVISAEVAGRIERIGFAEGERTARGKVLIQLDSAIPRAELDRAEASRALSEANYRRAEALLQDKAIAQRERDETYAQWQLDEASLRLAAAQLAKMRIEAPFDGTLGLRKVSLGDYVQPGQPLVNLEDTTRLKVEFRIPEKFSPQVKVGQKLLLESDALPQRQFEGEVYAIDPQVEQNSRSLVIRGRLENRDEALKPGQFVKVRLAVASRAAALFVPEQALIAQPKSQFVYKVVDGAAQMAPVQTGSRRKGWVEVVSGLAAGDVVVTGGHQKIGPGSPVQPVPADPALFAQIN
ncbi:MexH family multidrug efflux RND transporter periplasmic adaptor subunit [Desulfuromonas versatilis]|uniref:MexH family multidrug efflux RND transporter periplasmic adaptor subunit n=1 Tax=Desulfuromonas versatilis TaxID=2802975 RepID=A0ABN6E4Y5_9BACT|nr:efflux RND transporter periplasmic adaptor subunit [Desulfuromonas versatilis]BCR06759.1 MexH family multidrug efflux RND transporter periplasmic adaptor subunit [Desulfuromonas versatilis]